MVESHETSALHQSAVTAAMQACKRGDIDTFMEMTNKDKNKQIESRRLVIQTDKDGGAHLRL